MKKLFLTLIATLSISFLHAQSPVSHPTMKITDVNGKSYTVKGTANGLDIEGMKGKVIFLEFFGHKCPPCLASIPHLINLQNKYKDKLAVVAIEVQGYTTDQLREFAKRKGINYTVVSDRDAGMLVDYIAQRARWTGSIPFLVAIDTTGNVQFVQAGMLPESALEGLISQLSTPAKTNEHNSTHPTPPSK
jgi:thiol-disulfide isomerase/thioredoxin